MGANNHTTVVPANHEDTEAGDGPRGRKLICVDFDDTLTAGSPDPYRIGGEEPNEEMVEYVRFLKEELKHDIVIWTARPWSHASHIAGLLTQWQVPYNGIRCEKGGADLYIDDKALNVTDVDYTVLEE